MDRIAYWIYRLLSRIVRALPIEAGFRLGQWIGLLGYYLAIPYRRLAMRNLQIAFGQEKSLEERRNLARAHFRDLGGNLFASLKIVAVPREEIRNRVEVHGLEIIEKLIAQKRGFVFVLAHLSSWELLAQIAPLVFYCPLGSVYQRLGNSFLDVEMREVRARQGLSLFERKEGFNSALAMLRAGGGVGVLSDQHAGDAGVWCPFFGRLASTTSMPAMLALRSGAAIVPLGIYTAGPGRWRMEIHGDPSGDLRDPNGLTAEINLSIETLVRAQPADWFWLHNRWKLPAPKFLLATYKRGVVLPRRYGDPDAPSRLKPFRIVIRSSNWLGDALMSVPAARAIKRGRPDAHVTVLAPEKLADVWRSEADVDEVLLIGAGEGLLGVSRKLRAGAFDAAVLFPNSLRVALEAWHAGIPRRVGRSGHRRAWLLNQVATEKRGKKLHPPPHHVASYLRIAQQIGADISDTAPFREKAPERRAGPFRVGLCPGAEYGGAKRWPAERYAEVIRKVSTAIDCEWVILGVARDAPIGDQILQDFSGQYRNLIGKTTMVELMAELGRCDLLLTNDTGTMHLAAHLGVPTVAIFGSTEPALTGPLGGTHRILRHHVDCSPCFLRECPLDFRCMRAISVDEVVLAVETTLQTHRTNDATAMS